MALSNEQYDELMRDYDRKQTARRHQIEKRKKKLYEAVPELAQLDRRLSRISVDCAKAEALGQDWSREEYHREATKIVKRKQELICSSGCSPDYLEPPYTCPDCRDSGYIDNHQRCHCFRQAAIDLIYQQSGLRDILQEENFERFMLEYYDDKKFEPLVECTAREHAEKVMRKCQRFALNFDQEFRNILIFGETGLGKTFLTHCVAKELIESGHSVIYFSAHRLFDVMAKHMYNYGEAETEYDNIFKCDLLIIDDLGTEKQNAFTSAQIFLCLNERLNTRKSTMISTNLSLEDIEKRYTERVSSRMLDNFDILPLVGKDIRVKKRGL